MGADVENLEPDRAVENQQASGAHEREARGAIFGVWRRYTHGDYLAFVADDCKERHIRTEADLGAMMIEAVRAGTWDHKTFTAVVGRHVRAWSENGQEWVMEHFGDRGRRAAR
jgi:hypothetical protein